LDKNHPICFRVPVNSSNFIHLNPKTIENVNFKNLPVELQELSLTIKSKTNIGNEN